MKKNLNKVAKVNEDLDIEKDGKIQNYLRWQGVYDSLASLAKVAIFIIPIVLFFWGLVLLIHYWMVGQWDTLQNYFTTVIKFLLGYLVAFLQSKGIKGRKL